MIDRNWDGMAAHSQPTHDIPLGFVEGLNNKKPRDPTPRLRPARRGISQTQNLYIRPAGIVKSHPETSPNLPTKNPKTHKYYIAYQLSVERLNANRMANDGMRTQN